MYNMQLKVDIDFTNAYIINLWADKLKKTAKVDVHIKQVYII